MNLVAIGLGSNIDPWKHIKEARIAIANTHRLLQASVLRETEPVGATDQPRFVNGVLLIETAWDRTPLKQWLVDLESQMGRQRSDDRHGPRTIDLDIVVWNGDIVDLDVHERQFLKDAVLEVWPIDRTPALLLV